MAKKVLMYQMYPLTWGSFTHMTQHLGRIKDLGCTHVWLSPFYKSPGVDHGYDISSYKEINPAYGTLEDFDKFVKRAHRLGIKVVLDLVMNHTSIYHKWVSFHPEYYIWRREPIEGWHNWFDGESAWSDDIVQKQYYCHMFAEEQIDLNWFPNGKDINKNLVKEFTKITAFWQSHGVDGFRLDAIQAINKDFNATALDFNSMLIGEKATKVINAVFPEKNKTFLLMECLDPTEKGEVVKYYLANSNINFCNNILLKDEIKNGATALKEKMYMYCQIPGYMLELESHDSPRFTSRSHAASKDIARLMFSTRARAICLYQGQELGLKNPTEQELPDDMMVTLDIQSKLRFDKGELVNSIRQTSRANARVSIPISEYKIQKNRPNSNLLWWRYYAHHWKKRK